MPDERALPKTPPHSDEAEQSVIGAMLMDREAVEYAAENLSGEDFYSQRYGLIFEALKSLYRSGRECDLVTLKTELEATGHLDEVGDMKTVWNIVSAVPNSAHIKNYVKIVKENALYRRFIRLGNTIINDSYFGDQKSIDELSNKVEQDVYKILSERTSTDFKTIADVLPEAFQDMQEAFANGGAVGGIPSGFIDLDAKTYGFNPTDLIIVGARPSMGKSAFALNILTHMAVKEHKTVAMFSLEMSCKQLVNRIISAYAKIKLGDIRTGALGNDWEAITLAMSELASAKIFFDDTGGITLSEVRTKCRKLKLEQGLDAVFIDYLQLMSGSKSSSENRVQEVSEISRGLKALARELNVPIIALSQLSRGVDSRADHRPIMSDIRESGSIEQDADLILFLYRDEYYHPDTEDKGIGEVIIGKQRNGELGTVKLRFDGEYTRFANLAK